MKKVLSLILVVSLFTCLVSCTHILDTYFYPDEFTNEYFDNNYSPIYGSYIFARTYKNSAPGSVVKQDNGGLTSRRFYAIPGLDINEFVACKSVYGFGGGFYGSTYIDLYRADDCNIDPISDWKVKEIEIFTADSGIFSKIGFTDEYERYKSFFTTSDSSLIEQMVLCIKDSSGYRSFEYSQTERVIYFMGGRDPSPLYYSIRIHFKETDGLMWAADIVLHEGHYYLNSGDYDYIPLTEELEEMISSVIESTKLE